MADEILRGIDRIFDVVDQGVDAADRVLNRHQRTEELLQQKRRPRRDIIEADAVPRTATKACSTAVAKQPRFYIMEAADPASGDPIYIVTDGRNARTECATRAFATQILRALEKAP